MDIAEFLLARIKEREEAARHAASVARAHWVAADSLLLGLTPDRDVAALNFAESMDYRYDAALTHAAHHDPAYVLADCAAKRRIVERCKWADEVTDDYLPVGADDRRTLRDLASVYADHPDYREDWRL